MTVNFSTSTTGLDLDSYNYDDDNNNSSNNVSLSLAEEDFNVSSVWDVIAVIEHHALYAVLVNKYVTPVWYVIGLFGNVISALFWSSQRMRTCNTAAVYLTALALADFSYLALHVFYELENPWLVPTLNVPGWCQLWNTLYMAAQYFCVFLVCAFTIERFLSVCHPFKSERFGRKRSPAIIAVLLAVSLALSCPQAYFWTLTQSHHCHVRHSQLSGSSFYSLWSWCSDMLIFGALPILVLILNVCVLRKIRHAGRLRLSASAGGSVSGWTQYSRVSVSKRPHINNITTAAGINTTATARSHYDPVSPVVVIAAAAAGTGNASTTSSSTSSSSTPTATTTAKTTTTTKTTPTTPPTMAAAMTKTPTTRGSVAASLSNGFNSCTSGGSHNFTATTVTLLCVSFYLIFTTLPVTIVFAIQTAIPLGSNMALEDMGSDPVWSRYISYYAARVIIREIGMSHHVSNVFIYLATSRRFRLQVKKRVMMMKGRKRGTAVREREWGRGKGVSRISSRTQPPPPPHPALSTSLGHTSHQLKELRRTTCR